VQVVVDAGAGAAFDAVVAVVPPGATAAELTTIDAGRQDLTVDPGGFVVWIGPKEPKAVVLDVTTAGGEVVTCGPGSVSSLDDVGDLVSEEVARLDRVPWLCLAL
jgi:hypothetical protein